MRTDQLVELIRGHLSIALDKNVIAENYSTGYLHPKASDQELREFSLNYTDSFGDFVPGMLVSRDERGINTITVVTYDGRVIETAAKIKKAFLRRLEVIYPDAFFLGSRKLSSKP